MELIERIRGGLYGVAVGDALGGTTEFMTPAEIQGVHGYLTDIVGGGVWRLEPGEVTDDTMMTLCVAEGILSDPADPEAAIGERFLAWYRSRPKDIGNIIRHVLGMYRGDWADAAFRAHEALGQSAGNGSLMRCLPAALYYPEWADVERVTRLGSRMTHWDPRCEEACVLYNRLAYRVLREGVELQRAMEEELPGTAYAGLLREEPGCEPSGFIVATMRWVLYLLRTSRSYEEVVQRAANEGGDSDTIAAIAGGLAGLHYGYGAIPARYSGAILVRARLDAVCDGLALGRGA